MMVDVSVISLDTCSQSWGGIPSDGDSGGPLVCDGIAVGVLTRKVAGNKKQIIALPPSNMHIQENKTCHVAGWGFIMTGGGVVDS
ncbi:hypothetical protein F7725_027525 [Dissostichus mawsoni]|uniref:Peptidase S1 domain-containing protein n=1 Tax=Dissostichus mawsoni TaxID=36200 RepID=A0A7J5XEC3_DISMA|nr:hypothetical protein F7725_027525 [Dissostichus mawsoni]